MEESIINMCIRHLKQRISTYRQADKIYSGSNSTLARNQTFNGDYKRFASVVEGCRITVAKHRFRPNI